MNSTVRVTATGFGLIAVTYGFARFAYGLFLPDISKELQLSTSFSGFVAGGSFFGYCIAITGSAILTERFGARSVGVAAGLIATTGLLIISLSASGPMLAAAVLFAGVSTGLASPPMAAAISIVTPPNRQAVSNTVVNAGTSAGIALSGSVAILYGADWRTAYAVFTAVALIVLVATYFVLPANSSCAKSSDPFVPRLTPALTRLSIAALCMGFGSTLVWSFGGELLQRNVDGSGNETGYLWIVIGIFGVTGAFAGTLVSRFGIDRVHRITLSMMLLGTFMVAHPMTTEVLALLGGALFGASYIMLTGVYLVWGIASIPERPATGLTIAFLAIAVGQTAGAPIFGSLIETSFMIIAVPLLIAGVVAGSCRSERLALASL